MDVLEDALDDRMIFLLKDGRKLEGVLRGFDEYMNMVLDEAEERGEDQNRRLGTVVLRGNNLVTITPA
jgi:small nuclear ribonucleoprotein